LSTWSDLQVGNFRIGRLTFDPAALKGDGGALSPALVVPFTLRLDPRPEGQAIAVTRLEADLLVPTHPGGPAAVLIGGPAISSPVGMVGGIWSTIPAAPNEWQIDFRFPLTREQVMLLERHGTRLDSADVSTELRLRFGSAWVRPDKDPPSDGTPRTPPPPALGTSAWNLLPFAETRAEAAQLRIPRNRWPELLAGLGADAVRLVTIRLPAAGGVLGDQVTEAFDAARVAFDSGEYRRSIQSCRDIREAVESRLEAVDGVRLADRVGELLGWDYESPSREFLDNLWRALVDVSSAASHRRGRRLSAADARLAVLLTANVLDYLGDLLEESDPLALP
jgi:hypothetical protein